MKPPIVTAARAWIGTPYLHQASVRGVGCDCLGLLRGVWRDVYGTEPAQVPAYTADWSEPQGQEVLYTAARTHMHEVTGDALAAGQVAGLAEYENVRPEVKYGEASRIDFLLSQLALRQNLRACMV